MSRTIRLKKVHVIRSAKQLEALRTPARYGVLNTILEIGPCTVGEMARRLERKSESLYYHVSALRDAGLVRRVGDRPGRRRSKALYQAVAREIILDQENRSPAFLAAMAGVYRAALRVSERDLERALEGEALAKGPRRNTMVQQLQVKLGPANATELRKKLEEVARFVIENQDPAATEVVSLTTVLASTRK